LVVLDAPLLIEAGLGKIADKLIVVTIKREERIERLQRKTALSRLDILKRVKSQISQDVKLRLADFIIDNSGTIEKTREQVRSIRRQLWRS
jgi:dephospho-CoA kinase